MRILFITPYPTGEAPSQRFRFEQYFSVLLKNGFTFDTSPFLSMEAWNILYKPGHTFRKFLSLVNGYLKRSGDVLRLPKYDVVFIHRETSPFGLPVFAWLASKVFKKYLVYDFDDAIWIPNASESNKNLMIFKRFANARNICRWASVVSVGNNYLAEFARRYNSNVVVNPTTIDTSEHHNTITDHATHKFTIGWTGSHSTVLYLDAIYPVMKELSDKYDFDFRVICDVPPKFSLSNLKFIKWKKETEIDDLLEFNVGIMPLPVDVWSKGKCGFKALQYMALGIPAVVSDVGVNSEIVDHGINGYVCRNPEDWKKYLEMLLTRPELVKKLSEKTRDKIVDHYSVNSNTNTFISLFLKNNFTDQSNIK